MNLRWPSPPLPKRLPVLQASLGLTGPRGMCFHRSVALCMDVPTSKLALATFRAATAEEQAADPNVSPVPFIHCFVIDGSIVLAPSTLERFDGELRPMRLSDYLKINGATRFELVRRADLLKLGRKHGYREHLLYHRPLLGDASFAGSLLDAAGIEWEVTPEGGVVPKGTLS